MDQPTPIIPPPSVLDGYKKLLAAVIAIVAWVAGRWGFDVSQTDLAGVLTPILIYVIAQAHADRGKEAAKVAARAGDGHADAIAALTAELAEFRKIFAAGIATSPGAPAAPPPPTIPPKEPA